MVNMNQLSTAMFQMKDQNFPDLDETNDDETGREE